MAEKKKPEGKKVIQIKWGPADDLPALYANHLFISHGGEHEFHLIFGHLTPPIGFSEQEYPNLLEIKPISQIVLSPEAMRNFVKVMGENLQRYDERHKDKGGDK
ncbi:MAG: DUF3467 domain-containing protein [Anaerolineales bacterium]|nr:DUF3467 domain-containing protein [Anaerolineales bacterium]